MIFSFTLVFSSESIYRGWIKPLLHIVLHFAKVIKLNYFSKTGTLLSSFICLLNASSNLHLSSSWACKIVQRMSDEVTPISHTAALFLPISPNQTYNELQINFYTVLPQMIKSIVLSKNDRIILTFLTLYKSLVVFYLIFHSSFWLCFVNSSKLF